MAGRPTDYSEDILIKTREYLDSCVDTVVGLSIKVNLPSIYGLARYINVNRDTIYEWAKIHAEFSDTLEDISAEQAQRLLNEGLAGNYNSTIAKLILSSNHGMAERQDVTSKDKQIMYTIPDEQLKRIVEE